MRRVSDDEALKRCAGCPYLVERACWYRYCKGSRQGHTAIVQIVNCPKIADREKT